MRLSNWLRGGFSQHNIYAGNVERSSRESALIALGHVMKTMQCNAASLPSAALELEKSSPSLSLLPLLPPSCSWWTNLYIKFSNYIRARITHFQFSYICCPPCQPIFGLNSISFQTHLLPSSLPHSDFSAPDSHLSDDVACVCSPVTSCEHNSCST